MLAWRAERSSISARVISSSDVIPRRWIATLSPSACAIRSRIPRLFLHRSTPNQPMTQGGDGSFCI